MVQLSVQPVVRLAFAYGVRFYVGIICECHSAFRSFARIMERSSCAPCVQDIPADIYFYAIVVLSAIAPVVHAAFPNLMEQKILEKRSRLWMACIDHVRRERMSLSISAFVTHSLCLLMAIVPNAIFPGEPYALHVWGFDTVDKHDSFSAYTFHRSLRSRIPDCPTIASKWLQEGSVAGLTDKARFCDGVLLSDFGAYDWTYGMFLRAGVVGASYCFLFWYDLRMRWQYMNNLLFVHHLMMGLASLQFRTQAGFQTVANLLFIVNYGGVPGHFSMVCHYFLDVTYWRSKRATLFVSVFVRMVAQPLGFAVVIVNVAGWDELTGYGTFQQSYIIFMCGLLVLENLAGGWCHFRMFMGIYGTSAKLEKLKRAAELVDIVHHQPHRTSHKQHEEETGSVKLDGVEVLEKRRISSAEVVQSVSTAADLSAFVEMATDIVPNARGDATTFLEEAGLTNWWLTTDQLRKATEDQRRHILEALGVVDVDEEEVNTQSNALFDKSTAASGVMGRLVGKRVKRDVLGFSASGRGLNHSFSHKSPAIVLLDHVPGTHSHQSGVSHQVSNASSIVQSSVGMSSALGMSSTLRLAGPRASMTSLLGSVVNVAFPWTGTHQSQQQSQQQSSALLTIEPETIAIGGDYYCKCATILNTVRVMRV